MQREPAHQDTLVSLLTWPGFDLSNLPSAYARAGSSARFAAGLQEVSGNSVIALGRRSGVLPLLPRRPVPGPPWSGRDRPARTRFSFLSRWPRLWESPGGRISSAGTPPPCLVSGIYWSARGWIRSCMRASAAVQPVARTPADRAPDSARSRVRRTGKQHCHGMGRRAFIQRAEGCRSGTLALRAEESGARIRATGGTTVSSGLCRHTWSPAGGRRGPGADLRGAAGSLSWAWAYCSASAC
jgi:hypothetical protein